MNPFESLIPENLTEALGWTLMHSIWQGLLIVVTLAVVLHLVPRKASHLRYGTSLLSLLAMFGWMIFTFAQSYERVQYREYQDLHLEPVVVFEHGQLISVEAAEPTFLEMVWENVQDLAEPVIPYTATIWLIGFAIFTLRLITGFAYLQKIRTQDNRTLNRSLQVRVNTLAKQMGIHKTLLMLESTRIDSPMVIGHLKPVVLMPLGMITGLTPDQLDAVLAHELAHVRRHDYLINLVHSFIEAVLFYHPAYWWISARIHEEREHCCDDIAVSVHGDAMKYAKALAEVETIRQTQIIPQLAMELSGKHGTLMGRIQRLLLQDKRNRSFRERIVFAAVLLMTTSLIAWISPNSYAKDHSSNPISFGNTGKPESNDQGLPTPITPPTPPAAPFAMAAPVAPDVDPMVEFVPVAPYNDTDWFNFAIVDTPPPASRDYWVTPGGNVLILSDGVREIQAEEIHYIDELPRGATSYRMTDEGTIVISPYEQLDQSTLRELNAPRGSKVFIISQNGHSGHLFENAGDQSFTYRISRGGEEEPFIQSYHEDDWDEISEEFEDAMEDLEDAMEEIGDAMEELEDAFEEGMDEWEEGMEDLEDEFEDANVNWEGVSNLFEGQIQQQLGQQIAELNTIHTQEIVALSMELAQVEMQANLRGGRPSPQELRRIEELKVQIEHIGEQIEVEAEAIEEQAEEMVRQMESNIQQMTIGNGQIRIELDNDNNWTRDFGNDREGRIAYINVDGTRIEIRSEDGNTISEIYEADDIQRRKAEMHRRRAEMERARAEQHRALADQRRQIAEEQRRIAQEKRRIAEEQRRIAQEQRRVVEERRQREIAPRRRDLSPEQVEEIRRQAEESRAQREIEIAERRREIEEQERIRQIELQQRQREMEERERQRRERIRSDQDQIVYEAEQELDREQASRNWAQIETILADELYEDGLINDNEDEVVIRLFDESMRINGQRVTGAQFRKYYDIMSRSGLRIGSGSKITIQL
ncbi:M56 family metallopeptidase [Pontibacter sp. G13]|uniref:M56 family metallopeptidase n=1 Tax=Pontibacter sp. G13 TaxID=3074898 RepID=UPI00288A8A96|nr:M56 family metallopeptidase [Pontibacter sp. G13]WNJ20811.1 M56 family metallopeptidase [Pontibacter sp. G13]